MKKTLTLLAIFITSSLFAQQTYVPDDNFEQALINLGYDDILDNYVLTDNIRYVISLDVSGLNINDLTGIEDFTGLNILYVHANNLTSIDLRSNVSLQWLYCYNNQLTSINLSQNGNLNKFWGGNNPLDFLNIQNGNNTNITEFYMQSCPNLTCIQVDNVAYSTTNWTTIDAQVSFSLDCGQTFVPDDNFEQALIDLGYDSGVLNDHVPTTNISTITSLNISNKNIADLTGIEDFYSLQYLNCSNNNLLHIDISQNTALDYLDCNFNQLNQLDVSQNTLLTVLACRANQIPILDVSNNTLLQYFSCRDNLLIDLDVSNNPDLVRLWCFNNQLTSLNVKNGANTNINNSNFNATNNPNLNCIQIDDLTCNTANWTNIDAISYFSEDCNATYIPDDNFEQVLIDIGYDTVLDNYVTTSNIDTITFLNIGNKNIEDLTGIEDFRMLQTLSCGDNLLSSINLTANLHLSNLTCFNNQLTSLDVSNNSNLNILRCENNLLTSLNVSQNTVLHTLKCQDNQLTSLDLSLNASLYFLWCHNNQLTSLNFKNGNNASVSGTGFKANGNPNLFCIEVDDVAYSSSNWYTGIDAQMSFSEYCNSTYVPDDNFEQALIDLGYDTTLNNYVLTTNINTITSLNISYESIVDLTGIEGFTALTNLQCNNNQLNSLDVSQNTALTNLTCSNNPLGNLNLSQNIALTNLYCNNTQLTDINLSQNTALTNLDVKNNLLTSLDISQNVNLLVLDCRNNQIGLLDISNNSNLTSINCSSNQLTNLNISNNPSVTFLNTNNNLLENLNLANGQNTILSALFATANSNLYCINVDDVSWSTSNWTNIDAQSYFATDCYLTYIPDDNFEQALIDLGYDSGTLDNYVPTVNIESLTSLNINGKNIANLTGIEDFTALTFLNVRNNLLTGIDLSQNTALTYLDCINNQLTSIDITQNTALTHIILPNNQISNIDVTQNTALTHIILTDNQLTNIDVTQNTALTDLVLHTNQFTNIDVTQNIALIHLGLNDNQLTNIDIAQNTALESLSCKNNFITNLDLSQNTALTYLKCENNDLISLNLKNTNNTEMVSGNFRATGNANLTCIQVDDAAWCTANWATSIDNIASFSENCSVNVNQFDIENSISIYPNPVQDRIIIQNNSKYPIDKISIYTMLGKIVYQAKNIQNNIDINSLSNGIYLIKLNSNKQAITKKISVSK